MDDDELIEILSSKVAGDISERMSIEINCKFQEMRNEFKKLGLSETALDEFMLAAAGAIASNVVYSKLYKYDKSQAQINSVVQCFVNAFQATLSMSLKNVSPDTSARRH